MVRYRYSASGNYTLRLKVGANVTTYSPAIADVYSTEVQVLGLWFGGFISSCSSQDITASYSTMTNYVIHLKLNDKTKKCLFSKNDTRQIEQIGMVNMYI